MQTPRLIQMAIRGYQARIKWNQQDRMAAAWHGAAFTRSKKMPKLLNVLGERRKVKAQTHEQMLAVMQSLVK